MENTFCGKSFSLGFLEALFETGTDPDYSKAERYLKLCKELGQTPNEYVLKKIKTLYPSLKV